MGRGDSENEQLLASMRQTRDLFRQFNVRTANGELPLAVYGEGDMQAVEQLANCMRIGSAVGGALMADHHKGYSQPIGGVVAYRNHISPSGVGFDISCLAAGSQVTTAHGYTLPIEHVQQNDGGMCWDGHSIRQISPCLGAIERGTKRLSKLTLVNGTQLRATADHQIKSKNGWKLLEQLKPSDQVAVSLFKGFAYQPAVGVTRYPVRASKDHHAAINIKEQLEDSGLWPLRHDDPRLPKLLTLLGYNYGDGHLSKDGKSVSFYTYNYQDAQQVWADLTELGFKANIYSRIRKTGPEHHVKCGSVLLSSLFEGLGCPRGKKIDSWNEDKLQWMRELPLWLQARFISAVASAEATTPKFTHKAIINLAIKQSGYSDAQINFLCEMLGDLGFTCSVAKSGPCVNGAQPYVLQLLGGVEEQIKFFEKVGFCYAQEKRRAAARVASVHWQKEVERQRRLGAHQYAQQLYLSANTLSETDATALAEEHSVSRSFIIHAAHGRGKPRISKGAVFEPDCTGEIVWVPVASVEDLGESAQVYDLVTADPAESFIANGISVHNCGIKGVRTNLQADDIRADMPKIMDDLFHKISFGVGRKNNQQIDHPVFDKIKNAPFAPQRGLYDLAVGQLGTVGSGNHFVEICEDAGDGSVWIVAHFGSRGFGHKTATGFLAIHNELERRLHKEGNPSRPIQQFFNDHAADGEMMSPPVLFDTRSDIGQSYIEAMQLAGEYAYAGRDVVCQQVLQILGAHSEREVHEHHNYSWQEKIGGEDVWVVRKGATPAYPGQEGVVGGSMEYGAVVLEGQQAPDSELALNSTVHGAGRVMSRTAAKGKSANFRVCSRCDYEVTGRQYGAGENSCPTHGKVPFNKISRQKKAGRVDWDSVTERMRSQGIELRGAGADEAPEVYKNLDQVLAAHSGQVKVNNRLLPMGVAMSNEDDPYKD